MSRTDKGVALALAAATAIGYRRFGRPWHERWGATDEEFTASLPGDDLIRHPDAQVTRAISISAPADAVWAWLVQIGADRGGFYSYDRLEDLFRLGIHRANEIVPEWQHRSVGDLVYGDAKGRGGWYVMDARPNGDLVLQTGDYKTGRPASLADGALMEFTWAFVLREAVDGTTRLLVRERVAFRNEVARVVMAPVGLISFVMTQKMMREIKQRAERSVDSRRDPTAMPAHSDELIAR